MTTAQPDGGAASGPTVLRILLGSQLRKLREAKGVTRQDAGYHIRGSESKISRMELGRVGFKDRDIADLLTLYGVTDEAERTSMLSLAREANNPGWWHRYGDVLPNWFQSYLGLETAAAMIRSYEVQFVPGLLQTEEYCRAVTLLGNRRATKEQIRSKVELRMARQEILTRPNPPHFWAVVDEAALRRPIGGRDVMRAQIAALIKLTRLPNVRLQVLPFAVGGHAAWGGAFSILRFPDREMPDVVYLEQLTSAMYLERREDVDQYAVAMEQVCVEAEPPDRTPDLLDRILRDFDQRR